MTIEDGIEKAWRRLEASLPSKMHLMGVTYQGPEAQGRWVAFAQRGEADETGNAEICEGSGATPSEALAALAEHVRAEH
jgi:hypothetical protein